MTAPARGEPGNQPAVRPSGAVGLRPATAADVDAVARIWRDGWSDAHLGHVPDALIAARTPDSFAERAQDRVANTTAAVLGDDVVGFVMIEQDQVDQLYLDRAARGNGVGGTLLREAERAVIAAGHRHAWLAVATGNAAARRFYERQGWTDGGRFTHQAPVPGGTVAVDCHRFVSPERRSAAKARPDRTKRADAARNIESIVDAATRLLAVNPDASINEIAKAAGVGRVTLYGHFESRAALIEEVVARAIAQSDAALAEVDLDGEPGEALGRLLEVSWQLTHRFGALVVAASQAMPPAGLHQAHEKLAARARTLLERGRASGVFRDDMPIDWQTTVIQTILHGASIAVHRGEITDDQAPSLVRDTTLSALSA